MDMKELGSRTTAGQGANQRRGGRFFFSAGSDSPSVRVAVAI